MNMKTIIKLVPISGQDSLKAIRAIISNLPKLLSYLAAKIGQEIRNLLASLGMGTLAGSIEANEEGIKGDEAIGLVETGRKASIRTTRKALKIILANGQTIWRKKAKAVPGNLIIDDAAEKIFNETDPLDLSEQA